MNPITNISRLQLGNKLNKISNVIKQAGNFGVLIDKDAIKKKFAESDDIRYELSEYDLLTTYAATVDPRYKKQKDELMYSFYRDARFRFFLFQSALHPELETILDTLANEVVVINQNSRYFCQPRFNKTEIPDLKDDVVEKIEKKLNELWPKIYRMLGFANNGGWKKFKDHLIQGPIAWEIIYDNIKNPKKIIGMNPVDALTIREHWINGERFWIQRPKMSNINSQERILHDSQIIYIEWDSPWSAGRISYLHRLIRPFNIARLMERSKLNWFILNSMFRTTHVIPTDGMGQAKAARTLAGAMNKYRDDIQFNDEDGTMSVNGSPNIPANKEYWLADTTSGKPEIATITSDGPDLSRMDNLDYFDKKLAKASKIPISRLEPNSPETWNMDATSQKREEINFSNFVNRIRDNFGVCMLKPLTIWLCLEMPELIGDFEVLDGILLEYNKYNVFEELADMEILAKKMELCETMISKFQYVDSQGQIHYYFPPEYIIEKYMGFSTEEFEKLKEYRKRDAKYKIKMEKQSIKKAAEIAEYQTKMGGSQAVTNSFANPETINGIPGEDENTGIDNEFSGGMTNDEPTLNDEPKQAPISELTTEENANTGDKQTDKILAL